MQNNYQNKIFVFVILFFALAFLSASSVSAATLRIIGQEQIGRGQDLIVEILLDSRETVNAIEGKILYSPDLLEIKNISDGNSIINFWIEKPKTLLDGNISFSGIIPGGFNGNNGLIITIIFTAKKEGAAQIILQNVKTLLNDGQGTEANVAVLNSLVQISTEASINAIENAVDTIPPESFNPEIIQDAQIMNGSWVAVFATQDKNSGIDYYEIKESKYPLFSFFKDTFIKAESPYLLSDQELRSYISIKAVDASGNERIITRPPLDPLWWYENLVYLAIMVLAILGVLFKTWKRKQFIS